jgi:hypothetical protein
MKKIRLLSAIPMFLVLACSRPVVQFYPDYYYNNQRIYENKPLRFLLTFKGNWNIVTDPGLMERSFRKEAVSFNKAGIELLFIGSTSEGYHGTRGVAANLNDPAEEYATNIRNLNKRDIQNDQGFTVSENEGTTVVKWIYDKSGYRFAEFFFNIDTYDIRIAFWSRPDYFDKFLSVYEEIIGSLTVTNGL